MGSKIGVFQKLAILVDKGSKSAKQA